MKAKLKTMNNIMNNAEERISNLENRKMEITQSKQQTGSQIEKKKRKQYKKPMG